MLQPSAMEWRPTMGITLDISVCTPLSEEDDRILAGLAMFTMALANRNNL